MKAKRLRGMDIQRHEKNYIMNWKYGDFLVLSLTVLQRMFLFLPPYIPVASVTLELFF